RTLTQSALPIVGTSVPVSYNYPTSAVGNAFAVAYSTIPFHARFAVVIPGFTVLGMLLVDPSSNIIGASGILPAGTATSHVLSIPNSSQLLGFAFEAQGYDFDLSPPVLAFTDNDLEFVVQNVPQWTPAHPIGSGGPTTKFVMNRSGLGAVGWLGGILRYSPASDWQPLIAMPGQLTIHDIGIDSLGNVVCACLDSMNDLYVCTNDTSGAWGPPQPIALTANIIGPPSLAVSSSGRAIVVWDEAPWWGGDPIIMGTASAGNGSYVFAAPLPVESIATASQRSPVVVIGDDGIGDVLFNEVEPNGLGGFNHRVMYCRYAYGANVANPIFSSQAEAVRLVAVGSNGMVYATWQDDLSTVAWCSGGAGAVLLGTSTDYTLPRLAVNGSRRGFVMWRQAQTGALGMWASAITGTTFGVPVQIDSTSLFTYDPNVTIDPAGNATASWGSTAPGYGELRWSRFTPGSGWSAPSSNLDPGWIAQSSRLACDHQGDVVFLWRRYWSSPATNTPMSAAFR
ncbi:MAG: hypothetical protein JNK15_11730, partial [Planctomycetes bacterium]|nr:hypothetical protein [Planctomycetota bacterium]